MIILDNAHDAKFLFQSPNTARGDRSQDDFQQSNKSHQSLEYLPICEHGTLLVTSRNKSTALQIVSSNDIVNVGPMDETQGIAMLQQRLGSSVEHTVEELFRLATELDSMPLSMAQAASYIRQQRTPRCSVKRYLDRLTRQSTRLDVLHYSA